MPKQPIPLLFLKGFPGKGFPPKRPEPQDGDEQQLENQFNDAEKQDKPEPDEGQDQPPAVGDLVKFKAGAFEGKGKVVKVGDDGVTIEDAEGREHGVHWDELLGIKRMGEKKEPEPDADPDTMQDTDQNQMRDRSVGRSQGS